MSALPITGGCLCGAVRYRITAPPLFVRTCWCRLCQYLGSGNATVNIGFPADAVTVEGELRDFSSVADSGNVMHRRFCPVCGTQVLSSGEANPERLVVRVGTLDDPGIGRPQSTIWAAAAPGWAVMSEEIPRHDGQTPSPLSGARHG